MLRSLALGTILGGLVAFVWSSVSWEVLVSGVYTAVNLIDFTITWLLEGLVIAKVAEPRTN